MSKYTEGKWHYMPGILNNHCDDNDDKCGAIRSHGPHDYIVAEVCDVFDEETNKANGRLLAAAPELLSALVDLVENERRDNLTDPDYAPTDEWRKQAWDNARAAIEKAISN